MIAAIAEILNLLPMQENGKGKKNCEVCGAHTCFEFAKKLVNGSANINDCPNLDEKSLKSLSNIIERILQSKGKSDQIKTVIENRKMFAEEMLTAKNKNDAPSTIIDQYERDYLDALNAIECDVENLISNGKEMQALLLFSEKLTSITIINEGLNTLYSFIYNFKNVLKHFNSERLNKLKYEPLALFEQTKILCLSNDYAVANNVVVNELRKMGYKRTHWIINERILLEIDYLLDVLRILVEPEFVPLVTQETTKEETEQPNRFIPTQVKISVWRRDCGRCVECGSKERLEYDHIIPVSKGGSNTDRNIQLLCEKCNRKKSASIQ